MLIGRIMDVPEPRRSQFATVQDAYGNNVTVAAAELPPGSEPGDDFAYRVAFFSNHSGAQTMHEATY